MKSDATKARCAWQACPFPPSFANPLLWVPTSRSKGDTREKGWLNAEEATGQFEAAIASPHTYRAYRTAVDRFLAWCAGREVALAAISPALLEEYVRKLSESKPTKKLHLSALRRFFDQLVLRHVIVLNLAASVRAPKHSVMEGKTPALSVEQARRLLASIDTSHVVGLRDRAIIATLIYTAARVGAVAKLCMQDYYPDGNQWWFRFDEKGGKARTIPVRHDLEKYVEAYVQAAGMENAAEDAPLFRSTVRKTKMLTTSTMTANDICRMVKQRLQDAGLPSRHLSCHSFRATAIVASNRCPSAPPLPRYIRRCSVTQAGGLPALSKTRFP